MNSYPNAPVDDATQDTLNLLAIDPTHRTDRQIILDAIEMVADEHGGVVDPNDLRRLIAGRVQPNVIGATINGLAKQGRLEPTGHFVITKGSASGNDGRPARTWRWIG